MTTSGGDPDRSPQDGRVAVRRPWAMTFVVVVGSLLFAGAAALLVGAVLNQIGPTQTTTATISETTTWEQQVGRFRPRTLERNGVLGVLADGSEFRFHSQTLFNELGGTGAPGGVDASVETARITGDIRTVTVAGESYREGGASTGNRLLILLAAAGLILFALFRFRRMLRLVDWTMTREAKLALAVLAPVVFLLVLLTAY